MSDCLFEVTVTIFEVTVTIFEVTVFEITVTIFEVTVTRHLGSCYSSFACPELNVFCFQYCLSDRYNANEADLKPD